MSGDRILGAALDAVDRAADEVKHVTGAVPTPELRARTMSLEFRLRAVWREIGEVIAAIDATAEATP